MKWLPRWRFKWGRPVRPPVIVLGMLLAFLVVVTYVTPWPSAMVIRYVFERGGAKTAEEMAPHVPASGVSARFDLGYGNDGADTTLDVFTPDRGTGRLPTVVWIHGGAWISGSKADVAPYLKILASHGYTVVGVNYSIAPGHRYPTAVHQLNKALRYLREHADALRADPDNVVLAGDSAGAQLASQLATLVTNADYARSLDIQPALEPKELRGVVLNCGVYDLSTMRQTQWLNAWGFNVALWAYSGSREWESTPTGDQMSVIEHVTAEFPPTYISGGNGDSLTPIQSVPFAARLRNLGVSVDALFWDADHEPALPHEYQFHLNRGEAGEALTRTLSFLGAHMSDS